MTNEKLKKESVLFLLRKKKIKIKNKRRRF